MDYRREIDGLRSLAVVPVIFFHAGFEVFSGGYVGVDIFFVISGYLITMTILDDLERGKFSIINFYERRARRILPALLLVMFACIPFAWFLFLPVDTKSFSQSLVAVSIFSSNILFWMENGYFDNAAELKPLLHTWSLGVEEQFYIFFPIVLMLSWRLGKNFILALLVLAFAASFAAGQWAAYEKPAFGFYLLPTRSWELLIGSFTAFYLTKTNHISFGRVLSEVGGWLGIVLIFIAIFSFSKKTPFPGFYALIPTLGAALMILFATQQTIIGRFVGNRIFVGVGLISYSAYLWHQPLFAFYRYASPYEPSHAAFIFLSILTILIAYLSWRFVEKYFRNEAIVSRKKIFQSSLLLSTFMICFGLFLSANEGYKNRLPPNIIWQSLGEKEKVVGNGCEMKPLARSPQILSCEFGDINSDRTVFLYGDSHADAIYDVLSRELLRLKIKGIKIGVKGCEIVAGIEDLNKKYSNKMQCVDNFELLKDYISTFKSEVIVTSRWSFRMYPVEGLVTEMPYRNSEGGVERERYHEYAVRSNGFDDISAKAKSRVLKELISGLTHTNSKIILVYPVPEIAWNIALLNWRYWRDNHSILSEISIPYADYQTRNKFVMSVFDSIGKDSNLIRIYPDKIFCNSFIENRCVAQFKGNPFYYDDDHLSNSGAKLIVDEIINNLSLH